MPCSTILKAGSTWSSSSRWSRSMTCMQLCASGPSSRQNGTMGQCVQLITTLLSSMLISIWLFCASSMPFSLLSSSGLPYWLREIDHIIFRANNDPYKVIKEFPIHGCNKDMHVQFWTNGIWTFHAERNGEMDEIHSAEVEGCWVICISRRTRHFNTGPSFPNLLALFVKSSLLAPYLHNTRCDLPFAQIHQIENEYGNIKKDHATDGDKYLEWAAQMALSTQTGVPWIMCKQSSAPGEVVTFWSVVNICIHF